MTQSTDAMLIVLASEPVDVRAASALQSAAIALGYADGCAIMQLDQVANLSDSILEADPWAVMAIDNASIEALRRSFSLDASFAADSPTQVLGYQLVAVPGFTACLGDMDVKRVAWARMKAAAHPGNPLD